MVGNGGVLLFGRVLSGMKCVVYEKLLSPLHALYGYAWCMCESVLQLQQQLQQQYAGRRLDIQCQRLQHEIEALEGLSRELFRGLDDLVHSRAAAVYSSTLLGRLNNSLGWLMTLVCIYRVVISSSNVLLQRVNTTDPATRTLELLLQLL